MTKTLIPWHVFHDAIDAANPYSLDLWLARWRFMDGGVILFQGDKPMTESVNTVSEPFEKPIC